MWRFTIPSSLSTSASPIRIKCGWSMRRRNVRHPSQSRMTTFSPRRPGSINPPHGKRMPAWAQASPSGLTGWILSQQGAFYHALSGWIRAAKTDGTALWGLMGISFLYGIFHAAGPGHGKAVISSYLVANEETWRRGVTLSFASALLQAVTAVLIVGVAAVLIGAPAKAIGDTVHVIETVSYALIVLVGVRLLWVKGRAFLRALQAVRSEPAP